MSQRAPLTLTVIDLRGLPPSPQHLIELVECALLEHPAALAIDWGDWYPWSLDVRTAPVRYPESLVSTLSERVEAAGVQQWMILRSPLPNGYQAQPGYRELGGDTSAERRPGTRKLIGDLCDDVCSLAPALRGVLAVFGGGSVNRVEHGWPGWQTALRDDGRDFRPVEADGGVPGFAAVNRADDLFSDDADLFGSMEERAGQMGLAAASSVGSVHRELRHRRAELWAAIALLHERLSSAESALLAADQRLLDAFGLARGEWKEFGRVCEQVRSAYRGIADPRSIRHFLQVLTSGPRRELAALHARVGVIRSR